MSDSRQAAEAAEAREATETAASREAGVRCDFCEAIVPSVRRVALDRDYERLSTRHQEQYACPACSEKKEQERLGLARG